MVDFQLNGVQTYPDADHEQRRGPHRRTGRATQGNLPDIVGRHRCAGSQRDARCVSRKPHSRVCTTVRRAEGSLRTHRTRRVAARPPVPKGSIPAAARLGRLRDIARAGRGSCPSCPHPTPDVPARCGAKVRVLCGCAAAVVSSSKRLSVLWICTKAIHRLRADRTRNQNGHRVAPVAALIWFSRPTSPALLLIRVGTRPRHHRP
jgi:hypothetical protein